MFARFFEITLKPGKKQEFFKTLKEEILPTVNKYEILDLIPLEPETEGAKVICDQLLAKQSGDRDL